MKVNVTAKFPIRLGRVAALPTFLACALLAPWTGTTAPAPAEPKGSDNPAFRSVFVDQANFGKDPFFPKTKRRENQISPARSPGELPGGLQLKGISGTKEKRLAIINNYTLAEGEEVEVRADGQTYRLRCLEVRERSVLIIMDGLTEPREIFLRQGL